MQGGDQRYAADFACRGLRARVGSDTARRRPTLEWFSDGEQEIARILWRRDLMEIAGEDRSASQATVTERRRWKVIRSGWKRSSKSRAEGHGHSESGRAGVRSGGDCGGRSCERRDLLLQKFPPGALEFLRSKLGAEEYCAAVRTLPGGDDRRVGAAVHRAEAAGAAAHGREA